MLYLEIFDHACKLTFIFSIKLLLTVDFSLLGSYARLSYTLKK